MADEKKETEEELSQSEVFDEANAKVMAEMLGDPKTSENVRLQIINELNEASKAETFFETMFSELLTLGKCPCCGHENHWLVPEDDLNQMGWVSHRKDKRVQKHTTSKDCPEYAESCSKKKTVA
jgi:hypothetical protein